MRRIKPILLLAGMFVLALALVSSGLAGPPAPGALAETYSIAWWTVDNGGGVSSGGSYSLVGTAGQAEPGILTGGPFVLSEGFWSGSPPYNTYIPMISR